MRRYFLKIHGIWLSCFAKSRREAVQDMPFPPEEILTERQAQKKAEQDQELADCIQSSFLCDLMCP